MGVVSKTLDVWAFSSMHQAAVLSTKTRMVEIPAPFLRNTATVSTLDSRNLIQALETLPHVFFLVS